MPLTEADLARIRADAERVAAAKGNATSEPWKVYACPKELNELGREKFPDMTPPIEHLIGTDWDHPQLGAPAPVVTIASSPYFTDSHTIHIRPEDAEAIVVSHNTPMEADVLVLLEEVGRLSRMLCNACFRANEEGILDFLNVEAVAWWEERRKLVAEMTPEELAALDAYSRDWKPSD